VAEGWSDGWDPPSPSLRRDRLYRTYGTDMKWCRANLRSVSVEEMTFYLSPFTFHRFDVLDACSGQAAHFSPITSHFSPKKLSGFSVRLLYSAPSAWEDF